MHHVRESPAVPIPGCFWGSNVMARAIWLSASAITPQPPQVDGDQLLSKWHFGFVQPVARMRFGPPFQKPHRIRVNTEGARRIAQVR